MPVTASRREDAGPRRDGKETRKDGLAPHWLAVSCDGGAPDRFALHIMSFKERPQTPRPGIEAAGTLVAIGRMPSGAIAESAVIALSRTQLVALSRDIARALETGAPQASGTNELQLAGLVTDPLHEAAREPDMSVPSPERAVPPLRAPSGADRIGAAGAGDDDAGRDDGGPHNAGTVRAGIGRAGARSLEGGRKDNAATGGDKAGGDKLGGDKLGGDRIIQARAIAATAALLSRRNDGWRPAIVALCLLGLAGLGGAALTRGAAHAPISESWAAPLPGVPVSASLPLAQAPSPRLARPVIPAVASAPPAMPALSTTAAPTTTLALAAALAPSGVSAVAVSPDDAGTPHLSIRATMPAWVKLSDAHGRVVARKLLAPGEMMAVPPLKGLRLTTGNAGGTEVLVDGAPGRSLGPDGAVCRDLDLDTLAD